MTKKTLMFYLKKGFWLFLASFYDCFSCPGPPLQKSGVFFPPLCMPLLLKHPVHTSGWRMSFVRFCDLGLLHLHSKMCCRNNAYSVSPATKKCLKEKKSVQEVCVAPPQSAAALAWGKKKKRISGGVFKELLPPLISTHLSFVAPRHRCDAAFCAETWATVSRFRCRDTPALWRHFRGGWDAEETPACPGTSRAVPTALLCNRETPFFCCCFLLCLLSERWCFRFLFPPGGRSPGVHCSPDCGIMSQRSGLFVLPGHRKKQPIACCNIFEARWIE